MYNVSLFGKAYLKTNIYIDNKKEENASFRNN